MNHTAPFHLVNSHKLPHPLFASFTDSLCLFLLMVEIWSYLSAHISLFPPSGSLFLSKKIMLNVSDHPVFFPLSLNLPCLPQHIYISMWMIKDNTWSMWSPLSFPIVSFPISPSETFLAFFGSPAFKLKSTGQWPSYCLYSNSLVREFID